MEGFVSRLVCTYALFFELVFSMTVSRECRVSHVFSAFMRKVQWNTFYPVIARMCTIAQVRGILRPDEAMEKPCF